MTRSIAPRFRLVVALAAMTASIGALLGALDFPAPASAANAADFRDGYIISDQNFTDSTSMTADTAQAFLNAQVSNCRGADGWPCLKDYAQDTVTRNADAFCNTMPGGRLTAAQIIVAAGRACGISPKVLIVMLQKEQGLITDTSPGDRSYNAALGQACSDSAPCDPAYSGFVNQVYGGARQLRMYLARPDWYAYQVGWNSILYNTTADCGRKSVNILNDATRALYIYTPYTPNAAALTDLYGTGDSCSSHGNRNFWRLYTDWFGDPTLSFDVLGDMGTRWRAIGASGSVVGPPVANEVCNWLPTDVNCYQNFAYGAISWTPATGAWETYGAIRARWLLITAQYSQLGYPTGAATCGTRDGGCYQNFQRGAITWTPWTGAWETFGKIRAAWLGLSAENGALGYPTSEVSCPVVGVCQQSFEGGTAADSAAGTFAVTGSINTRWRATGGATGTLGAPIAAEKCDWTVGSTNCSQDFTGGTIVWTPSAGAWDMTAKIAAYWTTVGAETSGLGFPAAAPVTTGSSTVQRFQWGTVVSSNAGVVRILGDINARWLTTGQASGALGAPTQEQVCGTKDGGCYQNFENGAISWSSTTGAWETYGAIRNRWLAVGFESGPLGYPIGAPFCGTKDGGCYQNYQKGAISWSAGTGAWETYGAIRNRWLETGFESGVLGYPVGAPFCGTKDGGCYQNYQGGAISWSSDTGAWETYGVIRTYWLNQGFENGKLGYPTGGLVDTSNGGMQAFQGGNVVWDKSTNVVGTR